MLSFWIRPIAVAFFFVILAGAVLAELGTLPPSLRRAASAPELHAVRALEGGGAAWARRPVPRFSSR